MLSQQTNSAAVYAGVTPLSVPLDPPTRRAVEPIKFKLLCIKVPICHIQFFYWQMTEQLTGI